MFSILLKKNLEFKLLENQDLKYKEFLCELIPTIDPDTIIGVRTPILRRISKYIIKNNLQNVFLTALPHKYFEECQIHSMLLSNKMEYQNLIKHINIFLPYIDNWGTCDTLIPKIEEKNLEDFYICILKWLKSNHEYTVRFGVYMIMKNYFKKTNIKKYLDVITSIRSDKYYVNMMISWALAEALYVNYDQTIKYIENKKLCKQVQNKAIQKAIESQKISQESKEYLKTLKK